MEVKEQNDRLKNILTRLVDLKAHKDKHGKDALYVSEQPILWEIAKRTLKLCTNTKRT